MEQIIYTRIHSEFKCPAKDRHFQIRDDVITSDPII